MLSPSKLFSSSSLSSSSSSLDMRSVLRNVSIGMASASFWRGSWYIMDDNLYPNNPAASAVASLGLGITGMAVTSTIVSKAAVAASKTRRFAALYAVATSCVCVWRGTWLGWDVLYESAHAAAATDPNHATYSGILSHVVAVSGLVTCGLFASVLAPPAAICIIRDASVAVAVKQPRNATSMSSLLFAARRRPFNATKHISPLNDRVLANNQMMMIQRFHTKNFITSTRNNFMTTTTRTNFMTTKRSFWNSA